MNWIDINKEQPIWYENVEVKVEGGAIRQHWHRLFGMDKIYYGSMETDEIIYEDEITHWRLLEDKDEDEITHWIY